MFKKWYLSIIFILVLVVVASVVKAGDFCQTFPAVWSSGLTTNSPTFEDINNLLKQMNYVLSFSEAEENLAGSHRIYLPYGTQKITFCIAHHTTVATLLVKIDGSPSADDVDVNSSPQLLLYGSCIESVCPYTNAICALYGGDTLINEVQQFCSSFSYPNLICSSPDTLWEGQTFNTVQNTTILTVPEDFWQTHPYGAWLVYSWTGGVGGNAISIEVDQEQFDTWFSQLSEEQKNTPIACPLNGSSPSSNQPPVIKSLTARAQKTADGHLEVTFSCEAEDPDGSVSLYQWTLTNAQTDQTTTQTTTTNTLTHTYTEAGLYWVEVTVKDNQGALSAPSEPYFIVISKGEINGDIVNINAPKAIIQIQQGE